MTKAEIDKVEATDIKVGIGPLRPRDSATLILLDRRGEQVRVLMGRRHKGHAFMPNRYVFPGGRTDPGDSRVRTATDLDPEVLAKLRGVTGRTSMARARAIALSAVRETYEEAGLLLGQNLPLETALPAWQAFAEHGVTPSLAGLRLVARAITPPGRVRRFDTRFLAAWRAEVALELPGGGPTQELEELVWVGFDDAVRLDLPEITRKVLADLAARLDVDPTLSAKVPVPFYRMLHGRMLRETL